MTKVENRTLMMIKKTILPLALTLLAFGLLSHAAGTRAQGGSAWSRLGSLPAGAWDLASDDAIGKTLYAFGSDGISRTTDGGSSWQVCNPDAHTMRVVSPLPGQNVTTALFATTPTGLRRSNDACRTWNDVPTQEIAPSGAHIQWLAPYPDNLTVLYAGMDGLGGLYRSVDAGATWQAASQGLPAGAWITSLTADPQQPAMVFAGVRYPGVTHPAAYIYRSSDGGLTWRSSATGLYIMPNNGSCVNGLAWAGDTLLASTLSDGLYASTDRGLTWHTATLPDCGSQIANCDLPAVSPQSAVRNSQLPGPPRIDTLVASHDGVLLLSTSSGVFQSLDGAKSWQKFGPDGTPGREALLSLDSSTGRVLLGASGAIWSYTLPHGAALLPTPTTTPTLAASPTPPPPPVLPTLTPAPPTATMTSTPVPPTPRPTLVQGYKPSDPAAPGDPATYSFFLQTNHNLAHGFRDYWQANGGVGQFGYPITEEFVENGVTAQYFERARLEYHSGAVTLGLLGSELTKGQFFRPVPFFPTTDTNAYFGATGHSIEGPFLTFWQNNGREALLGYPISESFTADGSDYQWFERARIEWHSDLPENQRVVLGNIGTEALQKKGWLP
jgi:hypothetical protein